MSIFSDREMIAPTRDSTAKRRAVIERRGRDKRRSNGASYGRRLGSSRRNASLRFRRAR